VDDYGPIATFNEKREALEECLMQYKNYITEKIKSGIINAEELRNKNLSCWCKLSEKCHVDVLFEILNNS